MALEIELKLSLQPNAVTALLNHPLLHSARANDLGTRRLENIYYDTADQRLRQQRIALRVRNKQGQYIQTLKGGGQARGGMHTRQEWEWTIPTATLVPELLQDTPLTELLPLAELETLLQPAFSTDFERHIWIVSDPAATPPLKVELALDQGRVTTLQRSDGTSDAICELELELLEGSPAQLITLALQLAEQLPLLVNDVSKAQRGYRLLSPAAQPSLLTSDPLAPISAQIQTQLSNWLRSVEFWQYSQQTEAFAALIAAFSALNDLLSDPQLELPAPLKAMQQQLAARLSTGDGREFSALLETPLPGLFCLHLLQWLLVEDDLQANA
ncbi:CYTH domain-containing protein [Neptuniibacter sp. CAU 1671]|uniref:CYTH domain-containing protein n=1 Tax=Neptuniibacter sp. CAU 1671 TaxID=3032593 RepID=UPI0023DC6C21|nr:CYTH domain-containing protein [Neptuniibacter sp. CAU 1671]MDF2182507.1 CYTH domain-containing protein [Neptuniibacter sp. CAU 1671]